MDDTFCENGQGTIVTLADLETKLGLISHGQHKWAAQPVRLAGESQMEWPKQCVEIWYTNPEFLDMPNEICFHFPSFHQEMSGESETLVFLHPSLAEVVVPGLYFEGERLKDGLPRRLESILATIAEATLSGSPLRSEPPSLAAVKFSIAGLP